MKFFLDSADLNEIRRALDTGLIDGITTNPSLLAKAAGAEHEPRDVLAEICRLVPGPISAEVVGTTRDEMLREGRELAKLADNIVVKVPLTEAGLVACRTLRAEATRVCAAVCFSAGAGAAGREGGRFLHLAVRRPAGRHRAGRDAADRADRADLRQLRLQDGGARRVRAPSGARRAGGASRRRCRDDTGPRAAPAHASPAHGPGPGCV